MTKDKMNFLGLQHTLRLNNTPVHLAVRVCGVSEGLFVPFR